MVAPKGILTSSTQMVDHSRHFGTPLHHAKCAVVLVHGRDQDAKWMRQNVIDHVDTDGVSWIVPSAPGNSWYPGRYDDPPEVNHQHLQYALETVELSVAAATTAVGRSQVVIAGFSQGACVVGEFALRNPSKYGGVFLWTGVPITRIPVQGSFDGSDVYLSVGGNDQWLPAGESARAAGVFWLAGATIHTAQYPDGDHLIRPQDISQLASVLHGLKQ